MANNESEEFADTDSKLREFSLDALGRLIIAARDAAIIEWDQTLANERKYRPWERILERYPQLDEFGFRKVIHEALPHIVDTFMYRLLSELDHQSGSIRVSVVFNSTTINDVARKSWGLPAEPAGENGWLARFSTQRFEQPY